MFVGNDVVDLTHPENKGKSQDQRFLNRVFTTDEQNLISKSSSPDATLWALWAAKESAYKVCHKVNHKISSIPKHYEVRLLNGERCNLLPAECMLSTSRGSFQNEVAEIFILLWGKSTLLYSWVFDMCIASEPYIPGRKAPFCTRRCFLWVPLCTSPIKLLFMSVKWPKTSGPVSEKTTFRYSYQSIEKPFRP